MPGIAYSVIYRLPTIVQQLSSIVLSLSRELYHVHSSKLPYGASSQSINQYVNILTPVNTYYVIFMHEIR